jgi:uncharacterized protein
MLALDMQPMQTALAGRLFVLPYWPALIAIDREASSVVYRSRRRIHRDVGLDLRLRVGRHIPPSRLASLDHFLTARWVLYSGIGPVRLSYPTEHPAWSFREVAVVTVRETVLSAAGLPDHGRPVHAHFSDGVDARISWPASSRRPRGHRSPPQVNEN